MILGILAQGLSLAAVLALTALGLTVIYGVMGVVNLAHGEFVMLGAYGMVLLSGPLGPWLAIAITPMLVAAVGLLADRTVIRFLYHDPVKSMLGTFGLAIVLRELVQLLEGAQLRYVAIPVNGSVPLGFGQQFAAWRAVLIVFALVASLAVALWLARSKTGLKVRTTAADAPVAASLGISSGRVSAVAFALGAGLAGLAGALVAPLESVYPNMGTEYLVGAFLVVILAGLKSVRGALLWAAAVGIATAAIAQPLNDVLAQVVVWGAALVIVSTRRESLTVARV